MILSAFPVLGEELLFRTNDDSDIQEWKEIQKVIKENKSDWDKYVQTWLESDEYEQKDENGVEIKVKINDYNKTLKQNLQKALDILLNDEIIASIDYDDQTEIATLKIYSDNKEKYTTEYSLALPK